MDVSSSLWGSDLLLTDPKPIIDVHKGYIEAGADLVESSTYVMAMNQLMIGIHYQLSRFFANTPTKQQRKQRIFYTLVSLFSLHHLLQIKF